MPRKKRRAQILAMLKNASGPVTGSVLSSRLGVTRQVIVGDIAVLRAGGQQIVATSQGYLLAAPAAYTPYRATVAVRHNDSLEEIARELNLIVNAGGTVVDVTVEHPLYGELTASLRLSTPADVARFVQKMEDMEAEPLLLLTDGYHLHGIEAPSQEVMKKIERALAAAGYLVN